jgi:hypothetical protein
MSDEEEEVDTELVELFTEIVRHEFKASKLMQEMVNNYTIGEINNAGGEAVENIYKNLDSAKDKQSLWLLVAKIGDNIESESMKQFGMSKLQEEMQDG